MLLQLSEDELRKLGRRVDEDYRGALADHAKRIKRFRSYYQRWRNRVDPPQAGEEDKSNLRVPMTQWSVFAKVAKALQSLFGDDAEVIGKPVGPSDYRTVHKVGVYMTWRVFVAMRAMTAFAIFIFRMTLFGRAHAYSPWVRETYKVRENGVDREEVAYEGPGFEPIAPDDLIVPAEDVQSIQDFSFVIRKVRVTPQQLLDGEREGRYEGIRKNWRSILNQARTRQERDQEGEEVRLEQDLAEGVEYNGSSRVRESLVMLEWYGRWRFPLKGEPAEDDVEGRALDESEIVVRYLKDLQLNIGVQDLREMYPRIKARRPFSEASLVKDGSYWPMGLGELLESLEDENSAIYNLFAEAMQFSVGPLVFYRPGAGFDAKTFRYSPFTSIPTEDPAAVNALLMRADLQGPIIGQQAVQAMAERVSGVSDQTLGRAIDRPNAPRTASGQIALIEQGDIRASLDTMMLREDLCLILARFWELEQEFSPAEVFFRVTEEDAKGVFPVSRGGSMMTAEERNSRYDFDIKFATSVWSREAQKEKTLARYQLDLANPLIATNPRALWMVTNEAHKALGDANFGDVVPMPPDLGLPKPPREEWTLMLQGEDVEVNPQDNDDLHLVDHQRRLQEAASGERPDRAAMQAMVSHILAHQQQKRTKMLMQALTQQLTEQVAQATRTGGPGLQLGGGMPMPIQQLQTELAGITGGGPEDAGTRSPGL